MIDPKLLKDNPQIIEDMIKKRGISFSVQELIDCDNERRKLIVELQKKRHDKNQFAQKIALKKKNGEDCSDELKDMEQISKDINEIDHKSFLTNFRFEKLISSLPNLLHESVPTGESELDNKIVKQNSESIKKIYIKDHVDIANSLDLIDIERASKISGARFYFLKNDLVLLKQALINFALDYLTNKGYDLIQPPYMIRKDAMNGGVILDDFEQVIYKIDNEDLYMIGTSEHAIASMHMNEILDGRKLPIRYAGISPCFRKEAGAHGKDMKGIFRVHHFEKIEQFIFSRPEDSWNEHERILKLTEEFYEKLDIPFRVVLLCSADTGNISSKTYDIEAWMPAQNAFREIVSCSNCIDYQARRLKVRFRDKTNEETKFVHTLNSTLVATERTMVAILENNQTENGTIIIPDLLRPFMKDKKEIKSRL